MKKILSTMLLFILMACVSGPYVEIGGTKVSVEVPETPAEMAKGLMYKEHLDDDAGMLFVFDKAGIHSFWMKNTLIPLDMIFIDSDNKIVDIMTAEPCEKASCKSYSPKTDSKYVLEVNAGFAEKHNIEIGDEVMLSI